MGEIGVGGCQCVGSSLLSGQLFCKPTVTPEWKVRVLKGSRPTGGVERTRWSPAEGKAEAWLGRWQDPRCRPLLAKARVLLPITRAALGAGRHHELRWLWEGLPAEQVGRQMSGKSSYLSAPTFPAKRRAAVGMEGRGLLRVYLGHRTPRTWSRAVSGEPRNGRCRGWCPGV